MVGKISWQGKRRLRALQCGALILAFSTAPAIAAVVDRIEVRGAPDGVAEAVRTALTIRMGKAFTDGDIDASVKRLYSLGYFSDVQMEVKGRTLVVSVNGKQRINQIVFNGNKKIKDDKLSTVVKSKPAEGYDGAVVQSDIQAIKDAYAAIGRNDAAVSTTVVKISDRDVNLAFVIDEGERTKTVAVNFVGNSAFSSRRLAAVVNTKKSNFLSFLTRKDVYSEEKRNADEAALRRFYYNNGYADFRIVSAEAAFDEASNEYTLTFTLDEGPRYRVGSVQVSSSVTDVDGDALKDSLRTAEGDIYRAGQVEQSIEAISSRIAAKGYPFARVTPRGNRHLEKQTIDIEYIVDQGERAYVERIEIRGNTRTRDYVIRREFAFGEGDAFNQQMIAGSKRRLEGLGFFTAVNISTARGSAPDRVVVVVDVEEQSTGSFGIGAGVSETSGFLLEASVQESNFLGRGQFIKVAAGGSVDGEAQNYSISFTEPYFLGYDLAAGFDVSHSETAYTDYDYAESDFALRVTAPITERFSTTFRYSFEQMEYDGTPADVSATYAHLMQDGPWIRSSLSNTLTFNSTDNAKLAREGIYATLTQEIAGIGGDSEYYKVSGKARFYTTLHEDADVIGSLTLGAGHMVGFSDSLNIFDQFVIGGNEIRGFETKGIGPRIGGVDDQPLGGTTYFSVSAEASFPIPGVSRDAGLRGAVFADAGTLYGNEVAILGGDVAEGADGSLRASVGAGIVWDSPFGSLRFDYAIPLSYEDSDQIQRFKFGINNQF